MTVKELIEQLQKVEDPDALIVTYDYEYGEYNIVEQIYVTTIPETFDSIDDHKSDVKRLNAVIL